jgi:hypothetical protein
LREQTGWNRRKATASRESRAVAALCAWIGDVLARLSGTAEQRPTSDPRCDTRRFRSRCSTRRRACGSCRRRSARAVTSGGRRVRAGSSPGSRPRSRKAAGAPGAQAAKVDANAKVALGRSAGRNAIAVPAARRSHAIALSGSEPA